MATNKNAILRYQVLDRCFRNPGRKYYLEDLLAECNDALFELDPFSEGIRRRQLFEDFRFMESPQGWNVPLERLRDGKKVFYRYTDLNFSINNHPLNELELSQLRSALMLISRFKGLPQFTWIEDIVERLENLLHFKSEVTQFIGYDTNEYLSGLEFLGPVFNAILYKKVIQLTYKGFKALVPEIYDFHPYYLKQYNNRWFAFGYNPESGRLQNFPLDRISEIREIHGKYIENSSHNFSEYFEDIIGVTLPENKELIEILLRFDLLQAPYILTKPIHGSQRRIAQDNTGLTIAIQVIPNFELEQLILSYGEHVEIISPTEFRSLIMKRLASASKQYS